ncbi:transmembrane protein 65-like isoform X1 [Amphiura filiformis]|uniref:transmembrane protein 65-like isoform X1 n=1 Tax=Amphiura filiformis TaxID=82378 RepID=UPI003B2201AF
MCRIFSPLSLGNTPLFINFTPVSCSNIYNKSQCRYRSVLSHEINVRSRSLTPKFSCQLRPCRCYSFRGYRGQLTFDTPKKSREFIGTLMPRERQILLAELQSFQDRIEIEGGESLNAGHLEIISGSSQVKTPPIPPTKEQLRQVLVSNAIPFVGFGFLDNAIMIVAGDYIDLKIGTALCISTMAAAALGNLISDMAGIGLAGYVESLANKFGVQAPTLTVEQSEMNRTRWTAGLGRGFGIFVGCLLGMFPLLFIKTRQELEEEEQEHTNPQEQ